MQRSEFITASALSLAALAVAASSRLACQRPSGAPGRIMTVLGPIPPEEMGLALIHEHVLVDFIGADQISPDRYDLNEAYQAILPHLLQVKDLGCRTFVECTPAYLGRDVKLLKRLAVATGLHILTNTGFYGAADDKYIPRQAYTATADDLAARWINEWKEGIDGTGIRPGFIKIGVDQGPLSDLDAKLVRAAARTHLATGLTIASHTGPAQPAFEELQILKDEGVHPSAWIWVHAQNEDDVEKHAQAAGRGAWISLDGIGPESLDRHLAKVVALRERGYLDHVLLSHDAGWYRPGESGGGKYRPHDTILKDFIPLLQAEGFSDGEIDQLLVHNPRAAFTIRIRSRP